MSPTNTCWKLMKNLARICAQIGTTLSEAARLNIEKLEKRYPDGFDARVSMARYEGEKT